MDVLPPRLPQPCQDERALVDRLAQASGLTDQDRTQIAAHGADLVQRLRDGTDPSLMEHFLAEYGLSSEEGVALMCLAEALLRVPDAATIDDLIEDKIAPSNWSEHLGQSSSPLVNASTWGLMLTGKVLEDGSSGIADSLRGMIKRLGEPVIRAAVTKAIQQMGKQFVLGEDITQAMKAAGDMQNRGYTYSYDMLGEAAMTAADADRYAQSYADAITAIASACPNDDIRANPGISVKLSALHPRYEVAQTQRVMTELVPVLTKLARQAAAAGMGFNVDAEEMDRLELSLHVIDATLADPALAGWDGFGVVVQAYGKRAGDVIDAVHAMAAKHNRKIMVRLVKGAYWDTEIKHAQVQGLSGFPVFTNKPFTDVSYIANARKLLGLTDRIYPQFATHNAHTVAAILHMAQPLPKTAFEFQRLHGMGDALHELVRAQADTRCRIYAPVGAHRDLLAYLVRRLLENGANSSFVHQIVDETVPAVQVASDPFADAQASDFEVATGPDLFLPERINSMGFDLTAEHDLAAISAARTPPTDLNVGPILATPTNRTRQTEVIENPATGTVIGHVSLASLDDVETAFAQASPWADSPSHRAAVLNRAADLYEAGFGDAFALLGAEAGKSLPDALAELREAVDFLRYYAARALDTDGVARGVFTCISPWNFPLAIFTGQIAAALAAGNAVLAKPAETTPAVAHWGVSRLLDAGVPATALQLLPGHGGTVGAALTSDRRVNGVAFTGSTATARRIQANMASACDPGTPLIAETGGLNAMIVDSTALPEQAIRDIIASAFQSAGQRCSALRCLYVQDDIAPAFQTMLMGAMDQLHVGDPWALSTDVGPLITAAARADIAAHIAAAKDQGRVLHTVPAPDTGHFLAPTLIKVNGIADIQGEIFGPVLHMATFKAQDLSQVIADINATGFGLTFGMHTRIDDRVQLINDAVDAGNVYANRNQIGAVVGSQPFGGEGLSGTGPKAGGPNYVARFMHLEAVHPPRSRSIRLPGPTGELNQLSYASRPPILCLGPDVDAQKAAIARLGGKTQDAPDRFAPQDLTVLPDLGGVMWWGDKDHGRALALALAQRPGAIVPLITGQPDVAHALVERHLCVDTTAAGGNASLLAGGG